jgi:hypothetical protein
VKTKGNVVGYTNGAVIQETPFSMDGFRSVDESTVAELKSGDKVADGTIYAGISPDTGKAMYTTSDDSESWTILGGRRVTYTFNEAAEYANEF